MSFTCKTSPFFLLTQEQTVEPGCYFSPHLLAPILDSPYINSDVLKKYAGTGTSLF